ncbi:MAG TPA: hypothetical protein DDW23_06840 [Planctomycetes bacterium]|nr:hypothetical protein [Planctomycetota bacterium]
MEETTPATPPADSQGGKGDFLFNFGMVVALGGGMVWDAILAPVVATVALLHIFTVGWGAVVRTPGAVSTCGIALPALFLLFPVLSGVTAFGAWAVLAGGGLAGWGAFRNSGLGLGKCCVTKAYDKQFGGSFMAYLFVTIGLLTTWTADGASGTGNWLGGATLILALLALIASWTGMWKLPSMKEATGKLGLILFLAPLEGALYGFLGVVGFFMGNSSPENFTTSFWPSGVSEPVGPAMVLAGSLVAISVLLKGAKAAVEMEKARKAEERAARKASRQSSGAES